MNQFPIDILLEFLYNKFAITFVFCLFGSIIREYWSCINTNSNGKKGGKFNLGKVVISAVFSTFLVCAGADYMNKDLHIEVYAIISIIVGMWGMVIIRCLMNGKFISTFCANLAKNITNPILKSAAESASKSLDNKEESDKEQSNDNETNKTKTSD